MKSVAVFGTNNLWLRPIRTLALVGLLAFGITSASAQLAVSTLAGSPGASGSTDATGSAARFNNPQNIAVDGSGNLYVADSGNNKIRKVTSAGVVTTLAGSGAQGSADLTGTSATFNGPQGVAIDNTGTNLYVADTFNHKIRKIVIATGAVTTIAGTGSSGHADNATGTSATLNQPVALTFDSGTNSLYVADTNNSAIRAVSLGAGFPVTTFAGTTTNVTGSTDATGVSSSMRSARGSASRR